MLYCISDKAGAIIAHFDYPQQIERKKLSYEMSNYVCVTAKFIEGVFIVSKGF